MSGMDLAGRVERPGELTRDPVCGMEIEVASAVARVEHKGTIYFFDTIECAMKFQVDPEVFTNPREVA